MRTLLIRLGTLFTALALILPLTLPNPATAQVDLGNDGVDRDCADFAELNAAQAYFDTDGGSAGRNVDQLDPTGDGRACEAADQAAEDTGDGTVTVDADSDGLTDEEELARGTDPSDADSDNDRLSDGFEAREFGTNPLAADSDEDGLGDGDELEVYQTDPLRVDTDGDGVDDTTELDAGTDPRVPDDGTVTLDADQDDLIDEEELELGTDPADADSDNDRLSDGFEAQEFGTNPLAADSDEDGLGDGDELEVYRTDPLRADTDGEGVDDATELDAGTDPRVPENGGNPTPAPTTTAAPAQPTRTPVSIQPIPTRAPAQQYTPQATEIPEEDTLTAELRDVDGTTVAVALLAKGMTDDGQVSVGVVAVRLAPGSHGFHLYETGTCDPESPQAFSSAGGHYNPTGAEHGRHAGDLGNITAGDDGTATFLEQTDSFDLADLLDEDGTAIVIHAEEDENDPAGESYGAPIACGVLAVPSR
jgi:Cu/Zn superoxide dismutase